MKLLPFCICAMAGAAWGGKAPEVAAFEQFADLAIKLPPVIRTENLAIYSTNRLAFAMNNGLAVTRGGRIWVNWIAGGDSPDAFTAGNWSDDGGATWTDVRLVIDGHDGTVAGRNNIIGTYWLDPDGNLRLYTDQSMLHFDGRAGVWEAVCRNPDDAKPVWSAPRRIADGHVLNKPIVLRDGTWLLSAYNNATWKDRHSPMYSFPGAFADLQRKVTCFASTDHGATWTARGVFAQPDGDWSESQLVELRDGRVRCFIRTSSSKDRVGMMVSESADGGRTWTQAHPIGSMDNPTARFQVQRLKSGRWLFVCHGRPDERPGRVLLTAYLSDDEGATWKGGLLLDKGPCSYPDACQAEDGTIYVTNDHDRGGAAEIYLHRFTEDDVLAGKIVSRNGRLGMLASRGMGSAFNRRRFPSAK